MSCALPSFGMTTTFQKKKINNFPPKNVVQFFKKNLKKKNDSGH